MVLGNRALQEQQKHGEIGDVVGFEEGEEEDDDPVFVLTDEWKEFFAKSEAKRRLGTLHPFLSLFFLVFVFQRY